MNKLFLLLLLFSTASFGQLYEMKYPSQSKFLKNIWVPLLKLDGWHQDEQHTLWLYSNTQVPDGYSYVNAPAVIYANTVSKKRHPELKLLADLIDVYYEEFMPIAKNTNVNEVGRINTADAKSLLSYTVFPVPPSSLTHTKDAPWQRVSYG